MGGKSSGSSYTPYEKKDNLKSTQYVRILDLLGEGPLSGWGNGDSEPTDFLKSVYLDDTPIVSETGVENFKGVKVAYAVGTEDQMYLPEFGTTENSVAVGAEVKQGIPITRTVTDSQVDRVLVSIRTGAMVSVSDKGDQDETEVNLTVELMKDGSVTKSQHVRIKGKTSDHFFRDVELTELPEAPFQIRVSRATPDSTSSKLSNQTFFASYVEIIDAKLSYPNSAVVGIEFDSELFGSSIPNRNYLVKGLQLKVPSNYDPETRTYDGFWDGTFKLTFSNNPAWVFYDLVTAKRYGLGRKINPSQVDKWALYTVAQYCDQMVEDGKGGFEPRFTCNAYITDMRQAYEVLQDLVSCFRGMYVWDGQNVSVSIDRPTDPVALYTNSNVVEGIFTYSSAPLNTITTAVQIQFVDADDAYRTKTEYVSDDAAIKRYGLNVKRVTSFGCTSRSQAIRTGKWLLETSRLERQSVTFTVGRSGLRHLPFDVIQIADNDYAGVEIAGRIVEVQSALVTLDRDVANITGRVFNYLGVDGQIKTAEVTQQISPNTLRLDQNITPHESSTFFVRSSNLGTRYFRALTISENTEDGTYTISAVEHIPEKESVVDNGMVFEPLPNTVYTRLPQITGAQVQQNGEGVTIVWSSSGDTSGVTYQVKVFRDGMLMDTYNDLIQPTVTLSNLRPGSYRLEIRARNKNGQWSEPEIREFVIDYNITTLFATPELFAVRLNWTLPNTASKGYSTEIWYSEVDDFLTAEKLADVAVPTTVLTHSNLELMQKYYYWARIRDANGYTGEPSESVWCGPTTDPKIIVEYLEGKVDEKMLADGTITIAKFARSIVPPRIVEKLPELPDMEYPEGSIVTLGLGGLYQNVNGEWKPMIDTEALLDGIDSALDAHITNIPLPVDSIPVEFNGRNHIIYDGALYTWNGTEYVASGIDPTLEANIPKAVEEVPEEFNGSNHVVVNGEMFSWDGTAYRPQFNQSKVDDAVQEVEDRLKTNVPYRVSSIPNAFNGYNNLVLASTGQLYAWNGSAYVAQFDESAVSNTIAQAISDLDAELKVDTPQRVTSIPSAHNGYNHLVLISTGQMYSWNGSSYAPQFDKVAFENELKSSQSDIGKNIPQRVSSIPTSFNGYNQLVLESTGQLYSWNGTDAYLPQFDFSEVEDAINITKVELSEDIPQRVTSIPTAHNGFNNLVLQSTGQLYAWDGSKYAVQFSTTLTQDVIDASTIQGTKIADGSIQTAKLAANSVTAAQIAAGAITTDKLSANAVTAAQIAAGAVTATQISANAVSAGKIAANAVVADNIAANSISASHIVAGAVSTTQLAANAVSADKIAANAVTTAKLSASAVTAEKLSANAVTADKIAAGAITADKLAAGTITTDKLFVSSGTNLIPNPTVDVNLTDWRPYTTPANVGYVSGLSYPNSGVRSNFITLKVAGKDTTTDYQTTIFSHAGPYPNWRYGTPVRVGDVLRLKFKAFNPSTAKVDQLQAFIVGITRENVVRWPATLTLSGSQLGELTVAGSDFTLDATIDSDIVAVRAYFRAINWKNTTTGVANATVYIADISLVNMTTSSLIVDGAITADKLSANAVTAAKIAANAISANHITAGAIGTTELAANAVTAAKIAAGTITAAEIAASTITGAKIASGTITATNIAANTITASQIAASTITGAKLAANTITASNIAAGAVTANEIAANTITGNKIAARTIDAGRIVTGSITANEIAANSITAAKIAAGAIGADQIAARAISTDKLLVGMSDNLVPDPMFDGGFGAWTQPHSPSYSSVISRESLMVPNSAPAIRGVRFAAPVGGSASVSIMSHATPYTSDLDAITVSGGEEYWLSLDIVRGGSLTLGTFVLAAHFRLQDGTSTSQNAVSTNLSNTPAAVWTRISGKMEVPSKAVKMRLYIYATGYAGNVDFCNPAIYRRASGDLIVDGAITADKIAANSVTSAKILAGSIQAAHIAAGTITGDRIAANQTLSAPNISGGSINIASGKFSVTTAGVVSIKSGTSGERMEITNDAIKVYDSSNRVRVILGKLS